MGISSRPWAWPDVVAHPDGYATCGVLISQPETIVVEVNGVEVWRETMTGLFPRFCRMACLSDGTINVACASEFTDGLDYVYLVEDGSHTQIDQVVGLRPVMMTEESGDFVLYETITPFVYRRRVVGGATATFTNPFSGGTQAGILDVIATVVSWAESTIAPGTPQIATASNAAVLQYPMTRNTVTVGQAPGLPQTAEGLLALHNSGEVSTLYPFKALYPHIAYNSVVSPGQWIFIADAQGSTVIINSTDTQLLNTPYTSGVPLVPPLGPAGNTVLPPFQHPVIDPRTGGLMTRPWSAWALDMSKLVSAPGPDPPTPPIPPPVPPGSGAVQTYLTASDETATLPNSRELIAGTDVAFDDTTPGERTINVTAAGGITELTGDVTAGPGSGSQAATIANDAVTNAKLAEVSTTTFKGRITAGTGNPEDLTATEATSMLDVMVGDAGAGGTKGLVPAPAAGDAAADKVLGADGTWVLQSGGGAPDTATYLTEDDETGDLPNSRQLLAGSNINFDDSVPGERTVNSSVGGSGLLAIQTITATGAGTYTPTPGTTSIVLELQGAGGGGGGAAGNPGNDAMGGAGGGGGWLRVRLTSAFSGASYSIGAGGTGGSAGNNTGAAGGDTTFTETGGGGTTYTAGGGAGGLGGAAITPPNVGAVVNGGSCTNGDLQRPGNAGVPFHVTSTSLNALGSAGGASMYGPGSVPRRFFSSNNSLAGNAGDGKGSGGGGAAVNGSGAAAAGGDGSDGVIVIWEYS